MHWFPADVLLGANTAQIAQIHVCSNLCEHRCMSQQYTFRMLPLVTSKSWWSVKLGVSRDSLVFVQTAWWWRKLEMMTHHDVHRKSFTLNSVKVAAGMSKF